MYFNILEESKFLAMNFVSSQTGALWMQDGAEKIGDQTKAGMQIMQDQTNQLLGE